MNARTDDSFPDTNLPPLDQIRQAEAEITRAMAAARQSVQEIIANARAQAEEIKRQASETGMREGQMRRKEIIAQAEEEASAIVAEARQQANILRRRGQQQMEMGVCFAVNTLTGQSEEVIDQ